MIDNITKFCMDTLSQLSEMKNIKKEEFMLQCIHERLDISTTTYEKELDTGLQYLKRRNELNVIRKLNRLR